LIPCHRGVEDDFAFCVPLKTCAPSLEDDPVLEDKIGPLGSGPAIISGLSSGVHLCYFTGSMKQREGERRKSGLLFQLVSMKAVENPNLLDVAMTVQEKLKKVVLSLQK
jgi:hypothetical protein